MLKRCGNVVLASLAGKMCFMQKLIECGECVKSRDQKFLKRYF